MTPETLDRVTSVDPIMRMPRLIVQAHGLMIESHAGTHVLIVDTASGRRTRIGRGAYELLCRFARPAPLEAGVVADAGAGIERSIHALLARGLLVDAEKPRVDVPAPRRPVPLRFCHAPAANAGQDADITVLGIPYDLGGRGNHRDAPALIRMKSQDYAYFVDFDSRLPLGWHDAAAGHRIMAGVSLCDAGDVPVHFGEEQSTSMDRITEALATLPSATSVCVILGGDATSTYAAVRQAAKSGPLNVVRMALSVDETASDGELICVANLDQHLARLSGVLGVSNLCETHAQQTLPTGNVYLAIDLGAMDLTVPQLNKGLSIDEANALVAAVAESGRLVGISMTGLDMDRPEAPLAAIAACHVLLRAMHRAMLSRRRA